jgi:hypothetical protein
MTDNIPAIDLGADPRVADALERLAAIVPEADLSELVRAAILRFAEATPDHEVQVYVREQINLRPE